MRNGLTSEWNVIEVVGSLDSLDFTTDVELLGLVVQVGDGRVGVIIRTHDIDSFKLFIRCVYILDYNQAQ